MNHTFYLKNGTYTSKPPVNVSPSKAKRKTNTPSQESLQETPPIVTDLVDEYVAKGKVTHAKPTTSETESLKEITPPTISPTTPLRPEDQSNAIYRIQLIAVNYHNPNHPRYKAVKDLGKLQTELVPDIGVTRVLLGDFSSKAAADTILAQARVGEFAGAFIVEYEGGKRNRIFY